MLRERPNVFFTETLWGERHAIYAGKPAWLEEPLLRGTLSTTRSRRSPGLRNADVGRHRQRPAPAPERRRTESRRRHARTWHRHRRRDRRRLLRSRLAHRDRASGQGRLDRVAGDRRRDTHIRGHPGTRRARQDRDGRIGGVHRARRESARRHRQHAEDLRRLPRWRGTRSRRVCARDGRWRHCRPDEGSLTAWFRHSDPIAHDVRSAGLQACHAARIEVPSGIRRAPEAGGTASRDWSRCRWRGFARRSPRS